MKGVVFTEFLDHVAERYGDDMVDDIVAASDLASGGAYTTVGTYPHDEMVRLCTALAARTGEKAADLTRRFGLRLSDSFANRYPSFFPVGGNFFDFLESVEAHIHVEVKKLYPDAELPTFRVESRTPSRMVMEYRSPRRMSALAEGLILGSARHFGVDARIEGSVVPGTDGLATRFDIALESG